MNAPEPAPRTAHPSRASLGVQPIIQIRDALHTDIPDLLRLMRSLAEFEGYRADFAVTARDLAIRGFGPRPEFYAKLAIDTETDTAAGMAVYYLVPFTYDLRPTLVLKELYVDIGYRGQNIGEQLVRALARQARRFGCGRMRWDVLHGNHDAERFYQRLGGQREDYWVAWRMDRGGIDALAQESS
ncbi:MAG: GCN5-related N-acetyltransferase [Nevskia sp.]|nr:GCN5-related N-acetyltransferase [Nevskia sp.]